MIFHSSLRLFEKKHRWLCYRTLSMAFCVVLLTLSDTNWAQESQIDFDQLFSLNPSKVATVKNETTSIHLSPYIDLFFDKTTSSGSDNQRSLFDAQRVILNGAPLETRDIPNFGFTFNQRYWGIIRLVNTESAEDKPKSFVFQIKDPLIDNLEIHLLSNQKPVENYKLGRLNLKNRISILDRYETVPVTINPGEKKIIIFSVNSAEPFSLYTWLFDNNSYNKSEIKSTAYLGIYFGIVICAIVFAILILIFIRDITYLYYLASLIFVNLTCALYINGVLSVIVPFEAIWIQREIISWSLSAGLFFMGLFSYNILKQEIAFERIKYLVLFAIALPAISYGLYPFTEYQQDVVICNIVASVSSLLIFASCLHIYIKGSKDVIFFLLAIGSHIIGGLIFNLKHLSLLPTNTITISAWTIGSAIECILLSVVICRHFLQEKKARQDAKKLAFINQEQVKIKDSLLESEKNITIRLEKELQEKNALLLENLYTDPVTKLHNRTKLLHDLEHHDTYEFEHLAVLSIENFRDIYNFWGPTLGDKILIEFAHKLTTIVNTISEISPYLYRSQLDEFVIASSPHTDTRSFEYKIQSLSSILDQENIGINGTNFPISISFGVAHHHRNNQQNYFLSSDNLLLTHANLALTEAKNQKKNVVYYSENLPTIKTIHNNILWTSRIKDAINNERITVFAQPIFSSHDHELKKFEVLIRLEDEDGKIRSPNEFISIAIYSNLYPHLTRTVASIACEFFSNYDCDFSINLQMRDIKNRETIDHIKKESLRYNVSDRLIIELVENEYIEEIDLLRSFINEMRKIGSRIAIDDFGSGYSNFAYISQLYPEIIKIDGSLIKSIDTDQDVRSIVRSICDFSRQLGIKTTAEFIHNEKVLKVAQSLNIDYLQGYHLGEPISLHQVDAIINQSRKNKPFYPGQLHQN